MSTHGHIQWYFFRVTVPLACLHRSSPLQSLRVRFNIRNMLKKASLYNDGMLPAVYVDGPHGRGWHHAGANVCYFKNADTYRHRKTAKLTNFYTLSFVYEFQAPAQTSSPVVVYFAHCYPYSYSRLQRYLLTLQKDPDRSRFLRRRVLCKTLAGNICDVLTITNFAQEDDARTGVILTARVHPGESNASCIMHGLLDFLTGPSCEARYLRHRFVFKVVPMLNPDGVIHGNYRCSLAGTDLNRRYVEPSPELHPTVHATKAIVLSMRKTRVVSLYFDIHGHSR
jgi:cytosolic carboxypeptidase protein 2/3